jgi:hypothetical protein
MPLKPRKTSKILVEQEGTTLLAITALQKKEIQLFIAQLLSLIFLIQLSMVESMDAIIGLRSELMAIK